MASTELGLGTWWKAVLNLDGDSGSESSKYSPGVSLIGGEGALVAIAEDGNWIGDAWRLLGLSTLFLVIGMGGVSSSRNVQYSPWFRVTEPQFPVSVR